MSRLIQRLSWDVAITGVLVLVAGCGAPTHGFQNMSSSNNFSNSGGLSPGVLITLSPATATMFAGGHVSFSCSFVGNVIWRVNGVEGGNSIQGTIDSSGYYTAPQTVVPLSVTVSAQLGAFPDSPYASATVNVLNSGAVAVTRNSLVAAYSVTIPSNSNARVDFGPDVSYRFQTSTFPAPSGGGNVRVLVAGMKPSSTYHMRAAVQLPDGRTIYDSDHAFGTGVLPLAMVFPSISTETFSGQVRDSGIELLGLVPPGRAALVAADLDGNYIWYYDTSTNPGYYNQATKLLANGHFLTQFNLLTNGVDGAGSVLKEIDLEGNTIWQLTPDDLNNALAAAGFPITIIGTHHDFIVLPNGHLILLASLTRQFDNLISFPGTITVTGDAVIDLDQNHKPVWVWSTFDHLDVNRHLMLFPDWTHANAMLYSPDDGNLLISIRHQSWIVKIDYRNGLGTGDVLWKLGPHGDFQLIGGTDPGDWFYAQHAPYFWSTNTAGMFDLLLFDNGNGRVLDTTGNVCPIVIPCESAVPLLHVDEVGKTATILWRDHLGVFSPFAGYVQALQNGNIEFNEAAPDPTAASAVVREVKPSMPAVPVWQLNISGSNSYRIFRIPSLYPGVTWK